MITSFIRPYARRGHAPWLAEAHFHCGSAAANAAAIGRVLWGYASIDSFVGPVSQVGIASGDSVPVDPIAQENQVISRH